MKSSEVIILMPSCFAFTIFEEVEERSSSVTRYERLFVTPVIFPPFDSTNASHSFRGPILHAPWKQNESPESLEFCELVLCFLTGASIFIYLAVLTMSSLRAARPATNFLAVISPMQIGRASCRERV